MIDRIEIEQLPRSSRRYPIFKLAQRRPSGKDVLETERHRQVVRRRARCSKASSLQVRRGDRLAIIGPNGIGKSTLLKIVMGDGRGRRGQGRSGATRRTPATSRRTTASSWGTRGRRSRSGSGTSVPGEPIGFVRGQLGLVLFSGDDAKKRVGNLSGGEAARLVFARLAVEKPNVLVLDEPTNHLDLEAIEALARASRSTTAR